MNASPTRILVVDDSALYRQSLQNVLREVADARIVGVAGNGVDALKKIQELDPDLLTLDVQMPDMDGIEVLQEIKRRRMRTKAIMVSSLTSKGAQVTTDALLEGAFDFVLKPSSDDALENRQHLRLQLEQKILAFRQSGRQTSKGQMTQRDPVASNKVVEAAPAAAAACQAVIIGTSTGGPEALKTVLPKLPELPVPVFVVQHMPAQYTFSLAKRLNEMCELTVVEAQHKMVANPGTILIAPGGKQMSLDRGGNGIRVLVNDDPPEKGVRPSVDYLIRSACQVLDGDALVVILTGMGRDGSDGCQQLKQMGGYVFAQQQDDCVVYGMPKAVIDLGLADRILPLGKIAPAVVRHLKRSGRRLKGESR